MAGLARSLLFVGIVWSITGAFLILHFGLPELLDRAIQAGLISSELTITTQSRTRLIASCTSQGTDTLPDTAVELIDPTKIKQVRYASWQLGKYLGFAAGLTNAAFKAEQVAPFMQEAESLARMLGVPIPTLPKIQHFANALTEFEAYLESDPQCVAAHLTSRYGSSYGYLYKFAAVIGHATVYRANGVGGAFAPQIQSYGRLAGIPRELWLPITQSPSTGQPGTNTKEEAFADIQRLDSYLKSGQ